MRLEPMKPTLTSANGEYLAVICARCCRNVSSKDVLCDMDSPTWGAYYCAPCVSELDKDNANITSV